MAERDAPKGLGWFLQDEGDFCALLGALLSASIPLGREFRRSFGEALGLLDPPLRIPIGDEPIVVKPEVTVPTKLAASGVPEQTQTIDLVLYPDERTVVAVEVKVIKASATRGQLPEQHRLLKLQHEGEGKTIHLLYVFPGSTNQHREVTLTGNEVATTISWDARPHQG